MGKSREKLKGMAVGTDFEYDTVAWEKMQNSFLFPKSIPMINVQPHLFVLNTRIMGNLCRPSFAQRVSRCGLGYN